MPYWLADLAQGNLEAQMEDYAVRTDTDSRELKAKVKKFDELTDANRVSLNAVEPGEQKWFAALPKTPQHLLCALPAPDQNSLLQH